MMMMMMMIVVILVVLQQMIVAVSIIETVSPQMGYNTWNRYGCNINDSVIRDTVDAVVSLGLRDLGYVYINIDDCWQAPQRVNGRIVPDATRFPNGLKDLSDYIHMNGLKFGIYSSAGFKTCQAYPASLGMEAIDVSSFSEWGVDYLKYDNCYEDHAAPQKRFSFMSQAIKSSEREMFYSLCEWGRENPAAWAKSINANSWRVSNDIKDDWNSIVSNYEASSSLWRYADHAWNDIDMLEVGNGGCTNNEYKAHFTIWAMLKSPLIIGNDLRNMNRNGTIYSILTNAEVIAVNQDSLGHQARRIWSSTFDERHPSLIATKCSSGSSHVYEDFISDQQWTLNDDGTLMNKESGLYLMENGVDQLFSVTVTSDPLLATKWEAGSIDGGSITSVYSGRCLEVSKFELDAKTQGKRVQTGICLKGIVKDEKVYDTREHQSWSNPSTYLLNLYQRQCLTIDRDAPSGSSEIWMAALSDGAVAVMFLNKGQHPTEMAITFDSLNLGTDNPVNVRDLWSHTTEVRMNEVSVVVPSHDVSLYKLFH